MKIEVKYEAPKGILGATIITQVIVNAAVTYANLHLKMFPNENWREVVRSQIATHPHFPVGWRVVMGDAVHVVADNASGEPIYAIIFEAKYYDRTDELVNLGLEFARHFAAMRKEWNALPEIDGSETSLEKLQEFGALLNAGIANELMDKACDIFDTHFEATAFHEDVHTPFSYLVAEELHRRGWDAEGNPVAPEVMVTVNKDVSWAIGTVNGTWELDYTIEDGGNVLHSLDTGIDDKCRDVGKVCDALEKQLNYFTPEKMNEYRSALDRIRIDDEIPDKREDMRDALDRHVLIADEVVMGVAQAKAKAMRKR